MTELKKLEENAVVIEAAAKQSDQTPAVVEFVAKQLAARFSKMPKDAQQVAGLGALHRLLNVSGLTAPGKEVMQEMSALLVRTFPSWGVDDPRAAYRAYLTGKLELADEKAAEFYGGVMNPKPLFYIFSAYDQMRRKVHQAIVNEQAREKQEAEEQARKAKGAALIEADRTRFLAGEMFTEPVPYTDPRLDWLLFKWAKEAGYCDLDDETRSEIWARAKAIAAAELIEERDRLTTVAAAAKEESVRLRAGMIGQRIVLAEIVIPALIMENMPL
jgi:hypothetical protein